VHIPFPYNQWSPLSVAAVQQLFYGAPFSWALAGGYAVEQFLGTCIRAHDDIDIIVFRDDQHQAHQWLTGWCLYAAEPGTLREWNASEWLPYGIHDIWCHHVDAHAWQLQIMLAETDGDAWFSRRHPIIRGQRRDLIVTYQHIPCVRIEVQLLFKAKDTRDKDWHDFHACLPLLDTDAKEWLKHALQLVYPTGHAWLAFLA